MKAKKIIPICILVLLLATILPSAGSLTMTVNSEKDEQVYTNDVETLSFSPTLIVFANIEGKLKNRLGAFVLNFDSVTVDGIPGKYRGTDVTLLAFGLSISNGDENNFKAKSTIVLIRTGSDKPTISWVEDDGMREPNGLINSGETIKFTFSYPGRNRYRYNFGEFGSGTSTSGYYNSAFSIHHSYPQIGTYTISVTAIDEAGYTSGTKTVNVMVIR